jgi:hypothetical protein
MKRVFIVGCPRSGTTLLQGLIATHPDVVSFTESHFFDFGIKRPKDSFLYYVGSRPLELVEKFLEENSVPNGLRREIFNRAPKVPLIPGFGVKKWAQYYISILDAITIEKGKEFWVEKTPDHLNRISLLKRIVPKAFFIHIIRDGRDVVASLYKASRQWGKSYSIEKCIYYWNKAIIITDRFLNNDHMFIVVYEKIVKSPENEITTLFKKLNLPPVNDMMERYSTCIKQIVTNKEIWKMKNVNQIDMRSTFKSTFDPSEREKIERHLHMNKYYSIVNKLSANTH